MKAIVHANFYCPYCVDFVLFKIKNGHQEILFCEKCKKKFKQPSIEIEPLEEK